MSVGGGYPAIDMTVEAMTCQKRGVAWLYSRGMQTTPGTV